MKKAKLIMVFGVYLFYSYTAKGQMIVNDPINLVQGIVNSAQEIVQTSSTAATMINSFQETVKIYQQGKKYYDALKSVTGLLRDARKVQQTILLVGEISDIYVTSFQSMLKDPHFTVEELGAIAFGYTQIMLESSALLSELQDIVRDTDLSMTDAERMAVINDVYYRVRRYRNLVSYYTNKTIGVSLLRARRNGALNRIDALYNSQDRYW